MSTPEEKERRRRRMKRSAVVRDLHTRKYRQRVVKDRRRKHLEQTIEDDALDDFDVLDYDDLYDDLS